MASHSYPLWIGQSLLLERTLEGELSGCFSQELSSHRSSQYSSEKGSLNRQWPKGGHPSCGSKDRHSLWQNIGEDHCKVVYVGSWRTQGSRDTFKEKLLIRWLSNTGFASQHPTLYLGSAFRKGGAAEHGSTGRLDTEEEGRKNGNYHLRDVRKWWRA